MNKRIKSRNASAMKGKKRNPIHRRSLSATPYVGVSVFRKDVLNKLAKSLEGEVEPRDASKLIEILSDKVGSFCEQISSHSRSMTIRDQFVDLISSSFTQGVVVGVRMAIMNSMDIWVERETNINNIQDEIRAYRMRIGERYPQSVLEEIRREAKSGVSITAICKRIAEKSGWDPEQIRQAYYRRYPREMRRK